MSSIFRLPWGVILTPLGSILVAWGSPGDSKVDPLGSEVDFSWILVPSGSLLGVTLGQFWHFFKFFGAKIGGWVADLFFMWFGVGKVTYSKRPDVAKTQ